MLTFPRACVQQLGEGKAAPVSKHQQHATDASPWKLLLWVAIAGLIFGAIGFGQIAEDFLRTTRNSLHWHKASGNIVLVKIDDASVRQVGGWPWPRRYHAQLTDALTKAGAKHIFFDIVFVGPTNATDDQRFAEALKRSGRVTLDVRSRRDRAGQLEPGADPLPIFTRWASIGETTVEGNYQNAVWAVYHAVVRNGRSVPTFASMLANRSGPPNKTFIPDYSIDPNSIPATSAANVLNGTFDQNLVRGKDVVVGTNSDGIGDQFFIPGTGRMGGDFVQIIAAETLKSGVPVYFGWLPLFVVALGLCAFALSRRSPAQQTSVVAFSAVALLFAPALPDAFHVYFDVAPALFVVIAIGMAMAWRHYRARGLINTVSNLPNLNALRIDRAGRNKAIVAARILNYEEIVATLPQNCEWQLIEQIVGRLNIGSPKRVIYQGDGGVFAWFEEPRQHFGNHLDALHTLFRKPARIDKHSIDLAIAFGVEVGSGRSLANRLASALVAAEEAAHHGLKWKYHDPETLENASWRLSMLSQLDEAIDRGEVWVAYQPKLDIASNRIVGAEALARWTHPEKGPIAATEFVAAAEQHNRIGKLTDFVLEQAVAAAAQMNKRGADFGIAVNLSARLLTDKSFTLRLSALLARHGLSPSHLTLELTETAALADTGEGLDMISRLRDLGVNIAIDDYGTGQSTLDYLKKIPANEIKIDQSFVKGIVDNRSDRLMVQSTISLAHSLGRKVVAEGVEQRDILRVLVELECDIAQGFAIGRPMSLESLAKRLTSARRRSAA
jgi:EAL domain-containing protein (putative c-di-GMP-specific phosphodiesterase class I)/CHASE2 domain-containing sensor protein